MKKFMLILCLIFALPMLSLVSFTHHDCNYYSTTADSGFDSDYGDYDDGGSWGGGYDDGDDYWGNDYNNNDYSGSYSSGSVDIGTLFLALFISIVPLVIMLIIKTHTDSHNKRKAVKKHIINVLSSYYKLLPGDGQNIEEVKSAYANYVEIQKAWMNRDITPVRHLLTDEIYNMYQMQIETLIEDNQINIMSDFNFVCGKVVSTRTHSNTKTIKVILCVDCKDYIKSADNHKIVSGDKKATITYIYELTFIKDLKSNETANCPSCGASVKKQMSTTCPYCNNSLLLTGTNLTMSNKKILHQFKR